jgi:hypothetical protein
MRKGYTQIVLKEEESKKLEEFIKKHDKFKGRTFSNAAKTILFEYIEYYEHLRRYGPFLKLIGTDSNVSFIYDYMIDRIVEVEIKDRVLYCRHCSRSDCLHVGFLFAVPEICASLTNRGIKQPNIREEE